MDPELEKRLDRLDDKMDRNIELIAELRGSSVAHTLIKWVIFPLVSILAAAFGFTTIAPPGG